MRVLITGAGGDLRLLRHGSRALRGNRVRRARPGADYRGETIEAANFIATIEARQGLKIGCIEEAALRMGCVDLDGFLALIEASPDCPYRAYLERIAEEFDGGRS